MQKIFIILFTFLICCSGLMASTDNGFTQPKKNSAILNILMPQPGDEVEIKVAPNPAIDYFTVTSNVSYNKIILYNLIGKAVKSYYPEVDSNYNLSDLPGGIYILRFLDNNNQVIKTIKKKKKS